MAFDPKCYELAEHFLGEDPIILRGAENALAQHIQDQVELWIEYERDRLAAELRGPELPS